MDQAALQGSRGGLRSIGHTQLAQDIIDVTFDSGFADAQAGSYLFIALAAHDQLEYFHFSVG